MILHNFYVPNHVLTELSKMEHRIIIVPNVSPRAYSVQMELQLLASLV